MASCERVSPGFSDTLMRAQRMLDSRKYDIAVAYGRRALRGARSDFQRVEAARVVAIAHLLRRKGWTSLNGAAEHIFQYGLDEIVPLYDRYGKFLGKRDRAEIGVWPPAKTIKKGVAVEKAGIRRRSGPALVYGNGPIRHPEELIPEV